MPLWHIINTIVYLVHCYSLFLDPISFAGIQLEILHVI